MSGAQAPALAPKVPHACSCCDEVLREATHTDPRTGQPVRGKQRAGARLAVLRHLDGSLSEHTVCADCDLSPEQLPSLWRRACLLYFEACSGRHILDGHAARYAANVPLGILEYREP